MEKNYQINQLLENNVEVVLHPETTADVVLETALKKVMTADERNKLNSVENGSQVNKIEVIKVNGVATPVSNKEVNIAINYGNFIPTSEKGQNNGVATLGNDGKVPSTQLPSYVDDVLEFANKSSFPATGEAGKIYIDMQTNITYRWSGTAYTEISQSLALGETSSTAYAGDKGKANATKIIALETKTSAIETENVKQATDIYNIKQGTTVVGESAIAGKLKTPRNIAIAGDMSGNANFDGSANITINTALSNIATAGTYTAVSVDTKGRVVNGGKSIEVGTAGQTAPSSDLAVGGIFFKEI